MIYTFSVGKRKRVVIGESFQDVFNKIVSNYTYSYTKGIVFYISSNDPSIEVGVFKLVQHGTEYATSEKPSKSEIQKYEL